MYTSLCCSFMSYEGICLASEGSFVAHVLWWILDKCSPLAFSWWSVGLEGEKAKLFEWKAVLSLIVRYKCWTFFAKATECEPRWIKTFFCTFYGFYWCFCIDISCECACKYHVYFNYKKKKKLYLLHTVFCRVLHVENKSCTMIYRLIWVQT